MSARSKKMSTEDPFPFHPRWGSSRPTSSKSSGRTRRLHEDSRDTKRELSKARSKSDPQIVFQWRQMDLAHVSLLPTERQRIGAKLDQGRLRTSAHGSIVSSRCLWRFYTHDTCIALLQIVLVIPNSLFFEREFPKVPRLECLAAIEKRCPAFARTGVHGTCVCAGRSDPHVLRGSIEKTYRFSAAYGGFLGPEAIVFVGDKHFESSALLQNRHHFRRRGTRYVLIDIHANGIERRLRCAEDKECAVDKHERNYEEYKEREGAFEIDKHTVI